jgi:hypothetical protein
MYLVNLSLGELLALFGATAALITALYLLDRTRRRQLVATLRFWNQARQETRIRRRRKIREPLSLALQLLALALLLVAAAQVRWGSRDDRAEDHLLILDCSAWMAARAPSGTLMEQAQQLAFRYLGALPAEDRVMLVRAEALATPITAFETDRELLRRAIAESRPGAGALHLEQAIDFARRVQRLHARRPGEIVYAGCRRTAGEAPDLGAVARLRLLLVDDRIENAGIRKIGLRHSPTEADLWDMYVSVRNYGARSRRLELRARLAGAPAGTRILNLDAGAEAEAIFPLRTRAAAAVELDLEPGDAFPADDRARIELPAQRSLRVVVYSERPERLRAAFESSPFLEAYYRKPGQALDGAADFLVLDRCLAPGPVEAHTLWIEPPAGSPVPVRRQVAGAVVRAWNGNHPIAAGLNTQEFELRSARILEAPEGFDVVASVDAGPVIVASRDPQSLRKTVVLGFDPMDASARYQLAAPLLAANILRWIESGVFRRWELNVGSVGAVEVALGERADPASVKVLSEAGAVLPATLHGDRLRFFSGAPGIVRVLGADRELVYSLNLPEVGVRRWDPPASALTGLPDPRIQPAASRDLWAPLAVLAALVLAVEWLRFGRTASRAASSARARTGPLRWWQRRVRSLSAPSLPRAS